jgi:predicted glycogen debranching enzyme
VEAIVAGYASGTRFGIRADDDGLLAAGEAGVQLTWMDARADGREVTPRIGKPVEVQALWINALLCAGERQRRWTALAARASESFAERFWCDRGYLYDVVDVDHRAGTADASFRPNQLFAVGGLPHSLMVGVRARHVVDAVEARLWTPAGLRTLAPDDARYVPRYVGPSGVRDAGYHQGTAWPWLAGAFIDAWIRVRGESAQSRRDARTRFLDPLIAHYRNAGLGHVAEIADGDAPHVSRGCPFQAWSVGEALRAHGLTLDDRR